MTQLSLKNNASVLSRVDTIQEWLETRFCSPSYGGCVLAGIAICFFGAAMNTMAGWLYVLSGMLIALLVVSAFVCLRSLRHLKIRRFPTNAVSVGEQLVLELEIHNPTSEAKNLLEVYDLLPIVLTPPRKEAIEVIPPQSQYRWLDPIIAQRRGIYQWQEVQLRTATPLGLFWCRRTYQVPGKATIYPTILPLKYCPLIDTLGQDDRLQLPSDRRYQAANEGITKAIRPYRFGDPTRLIHWRSSARFSELKVRELEIITGGQNIIVGLDTDHTWSSDDFEQAVTVAASLYSYAIRCELNVQLWTAGTGLVHGLPAVLEALAEVQPEENTTQLPPFAVPLIWLTHNPLTINNLSYPSRWILFSGDTVTDNQINSHLSGITINSQDALPKQLQTRMV